MSTVRFIEHNGERIDIDMARVVTELRCDLCGEFTDRDDALQVNVGIQKALQVNVDIQKRGALLTAPVQLDAHPSCARQLGDRIGETIDRALAASS